jgi:hypothetical protein
MGLNVKSRKLPRGGLDRFNVYLKCIEKEFGKEWLESRKGHPLMELWIRTDVFASIQLFQFGYSLKKLKNINTKWFNDLIQKIKTGSSGDRRGAVLEALFASQLHMPPERVAELPRPNNPGYDIKVTQCNGSMIYYQVKNNNWSDQYYKAKEKARSVEEIFKENLGPDALQVIIRITTDPDDRDWNILKNQLPKLINETSSEEDIEKEIDGKWSIRFLKLHSADIPLHPNKKSYVMQLITPIHQAEKNKIKININNACNDLEKKMESDMEKSINIVLICIPLDAPFALCGEWVNEYFQENPAARVSGVLLYKPGVVSEVEREEDYFSHAFHLVIKNEKRAWIKALTTLDIAIGKGSHSVEGINNIDNYFLLIDGAKRYDFKRHHVYQSGIINYLIDKNRCVKLRNLSGIQNHVFYIDSDRKEKEALIDMPRDTDLVLLR